MTGEHFTKWQNRNKEFKEPDHPYPAKAWPFIKAIVGIGYLISHNEHID
jgi:hypothetical protein